MTMANLLAGFGNYVFAFDNKAVTRAAKFWGADIPGFMASARVTGSK